MTHPWTIHAALATSAAPAHHPGSGALIAVLLLAAAVYAAGYAISVRIHPYRPCRACGESGKHRGTIFRRSFAGCGRCGGTGRELRRFAREP